MLNELADIYGPTFTLHANMKKLSSNKVLISMLFEIEKIEWIQDFAHNTEIFHKFLDRDENADGPIHIQTKTKPESYTHDTICVVLKDGVYEDFEW